MKDNDSYIEELTVGENWIGLKMFLSKGESFKTLLDMLTHIYQGFFIVKISGFKRLFPDSRKVDKGIDKPYLERVKEFSPEMDFFSSSTVMPQRDLTGQDYLLITLPMISKRLSS